LPRAPQTQYMLLLISDGKTADVRCFEKSILVPKGKPRFFGKPQNDEAQKNLPPRGKVDAERTDEGSGGKGA